MPQQLRKRLTEEQVKVILENYVSGEITAQSARENLSLKHSQFFDLVKAYRDNPDTFTLTPPKKDNSHLKISDEAEKLIIKELKKEKQLIDNKDMPVRFYNYSAVRDDLLTQHGVKVSVPTIISRAKDNGFYLPKRQKKIHDHEVITNFTGELIQHDSSHHLWAPDGKQKWHLITSLDDHSRALLYADFWLRETTWHHILALQSVFLRYGLPFAYYADQHSIFRYVHDRDKNNPWHGYKTFTDDIDPQWKKVLRDCEVKSIYALSPQAKGKIERPYQWLQDHVVRTCARRDIATITEARQILKYEVEQYNWKRLKGYFEVHRWRGADVPVATGRQRTKNPVSG